MNAVSQPQTNCPQVMTAQWVLPISGAPIEQGFVAMADGKIVAVDALSALPADWAAEMPLPGTLLTPGLVNAHVHLEQSFPEPIAKGAGEPFCEWLLRVVGKISQDSSPEAKLQRSMAGAHEVLATGTTCVNDVASGPESLQALDRLGLRGIVSLEVFHPAVEPIHIEHWVNQYQALQQAFKGHPRLAVGLSPHSPYNVAPGAWQALLEACHPPLVHTHLAEFEDEVCYLQGNLSCVQTLHQRILGREFAPQVPAESPVAYLQTFGLLNARTVAAHCIHTSPEDRQFLANAGVSVAHCPRSNMALHGQTLKAGDWQGLEISLALGTDGRLSTENLDLRAEARCAMALHGWSPLQALKAMTRQGAKALGLTSETGVLSPGFSADCVLWQAAESVKENPEAAVLDDRTQVSRVFIQGQGRWPEEKTDD